MPKDNAFLVILQTSGKPRDFLKQSFEEIKQLTESAGGLVVGGLQAHLSHPSPSHFIRAGKLQEIREGCRQSQANVVIFNADLSPVQARNLEAVSGLRVVDRTGLILDIFARRAESHEGRLQVELAQLNYLMPRLIGKGVLLSRLGGGIGSRGPGEQKLEIDRRKIRMRIQRIKKDLEKLRRHRELLRASRRQKRLIQVALVGYTNAGKTTLLNALTGSNAYAADKLFATLDPRTRIQKIRGRSDVLFTDTVGFLKDLPHTLVEAFQATLEEVTHADLILHILDISSRNLEEEKETVESVLKEIKADQKKKILALNKADCLEKSDLEVIQGRFPEGVPISAKFGYGLKSLILKLEEIIGVQEDLLKA